MIWIDAQMSPALAVWLDDNMGCAAVGVRDVGLRDATDAEIFAAAKKANAIVMTKDIDFVYLLDRFGPPPQVIWITCGNTSNARLKEILASALPQALALLKAGDELVEIAG